MANTEVDGEKICPDALLFDRRLDLAIAYRAHLGGFVNRTASGRSYLLRPLLLPTDLPTSPAIMTVAVVLLRSLARGWETWMWCAAGYNGGGGLVASAAMVDDGVLPCWWSGGYGGVPVVYCRPEARGRRAGGGALSIWPSASLSRLWSLSPFPLYCWLRKWKIIWLLDSVVVQRVEERISTLENCIVCNDQVALTHTNLDRVSSLCGEEFLENPGSIPTIDDSPWPAPVSLGANVGGPGTVKRTERKTLVANCPLIEPRSLMKKKLRTRLLVSNLEVPHRL
nr:eukaryotic translation initiation factor 6-2-like [Ipomoea batatas]GMD78235.1 eukaryotic translation initiation factor 6-2-like [Ipomoea batatas]